MSHRQQHVMGSARNSATLCALAVSCIAAAVTVYLKLDGMTRAYPLGVLAVLAALTVFGWCVWRGNRSMQTTVAILFVGETVFGLIGGFQGSVQDPALPIGAADLSVVLLWTSVLMQAVLAGTKCVHDRVVRRQA